MKTYKFTDSKMTCRGHKFEVGVRYEIEGELILCANGFHSCASGVNLGKYYNPSNSRLFECEVMGEWIGDLEDKICSRDIKLIKEVTFYDAMRILNDFTGSENTNTGFGNKGDYNTGNYNIGNDNIGNSNIGNYNIGNSNIGNSNIGNYNTI